MRGNTSNFSTKADIIVMILDGFNLDDIGPPSQGTGFLGFYGNT